MHTPKNMIPFDLEKAKSGVPVVTRTGRKVRIVCFDAGIYNNQNLLCLIGDGPDRSIVTYTENGRYDDSGITGLDLFHPIPEMWVNVFESSDGPLFATYSVYGDKATAEKYAIGYSRPHIGTFKLVKE